MMEEAYALCDSLQWLQSHPMRDATIEIDSQVIVDAIKNLVEMLSSFGIVIDDC